MNFSKEQFIEWTTTGYPFVFNEIVTKEMFFLGLGDFINQSENGFVAATEDHEVNVYDDTFGLIMTVNHSDEKVNLLTDINSNNDITPDSEEFLEKQHCLGDVCVGVITFCQCMKEFFVQGKPTKEGLIKLSSKVKEVSDPWPLQS